MATWEDLQKVNSEIKTTPIKGKEYAEVPQRIQAFRKLYPEGYITSEIKHWSNEIVVMSAECGFYEADGRKHVLGTGTAFEKHDSTFINKTSYLENCETSAVGRALGMAGFGVDGSVASALEVANAIENQNKEKKPIESKDDKEEKPIESEDDLDLPMTPEQLKEINRQMKRTGVSYEKLSAAIGKQVKDASRVEAEMLIRRLKISKGAK